jgi:GNAT superfamily N-acetyltransferase
VASAHPADVGAAFGFVRSLAEFEHGLADVRTSLEVFTRDGFGPAQQFHIILAEEPCEEGEGSGSAPSGFPWQGFKAVGMAFFHATYSTWQGRTVYLEDLFIQQSHRRLGLAARLFRVLSRAALAAGAVRLQWCCLDWNEGAQQLYEGPALRAERLREWVLYRLYVEDMERVAAGKSGPVRA